MHGKNDRYYCIKVSKKSILERYFDVLFWHYFVLIFFTSAHEDKFHLYPRSRAICKRRKSVFHFCLTLSGFRSKKLLNHDGKLAKIHHVVAEFTKCSGCLPSILIVDNRIFLHFGDRLDCVAHRFAQCPFRFLFRRQTQEIPMARK